MGTDFNYAAAVEQLDVEALMQDLKKCRENPRNSIRSANS
jgi:catalase (peroxidase I)